MSINACRVRSLLGTGDFRTLFLDELGWDNATGSIAVEAKEQTFVLQLVAEKRGVQVFLCPPDEQGRIPPADVRSALDRELVKSAREHLLIFTAEDRAEHLWVYPRREPGRPVRLIPYRFDQNSSNELLLQKLASIRFILSEEEELNLIEVTRRLQESLDRDRLTRSFYQRFERERAAFEEMIEGIPDDDLAKWYVAVLVNRLMFIYFVQEKGFLDGNQRYLQSKLTQSGGSYYKDFLCPLFFEGFAVPEANRSVAASAMLGRVPYLNGGIFQKHQVEELHGQAIDIPDVAFQRLFAFFDEYRWHLDERPLVEGNEINPDVLGYIFEKYVNQRQMGAYYTKEDITEYISKNTVIPFLLGAARADCRVAFDNDGGPTVWDLLSEDPDRYIYPALRHEALRSLPDEIRTGMNPPTLHRQVGDAPLPTSELRQGWNKPAPAEYALPTETWREVVARRARYDEVRNILAAGQVRRAGDLVTLNLDLRQFAQDVIENCEGPELLRALWHAIEDVTVLDPTCGSGAFLFAALNVLEPLYEACLDRMEAFIGDLELHGDAGGVEKYCDFREVLDRVAGHPNRRYFVLKSIILNNLFGVDIMEEAVEICKLRLFLKLAAQVEPNLAHTNLGIDPLPDIDFNIKAGNTLVGFVTYDEVERAVTRKLDFENAMESIADKANTLQEAFDAFRSGQIEGDGSVSAEHKHELRDRLEGLRRELNQYLATEYGVSPNNERIYRSWLASHQPFHWFVEFYGIMGTGGFDVVIGNPPYLEYSKVTEYAIRGYETEACANLYAFTVERSLLLVHPGGRLGMIIPISVACSGAMDSLRRRLVSSRRSLWLSHYSNRPGQLFTGAQNRLTIVITSGQGDAQATFSTRYHRWDAKHGEREHLFATLRYLELDGGGSMFHGLFPKVGDAAGASALRKMQSNRTLEFYKTRAGAHRVFWVRVPGYFCIFLVDPPMARPERGGAPRVRGEVNKIAFDSEGSRDVVHAVLNSSAYYQFFCAYTDTRHINPSDVSDFPLDLDSFSPPIRQALREASSNLSDCFEIHTSQWRKSGLLIDSVDAKPCKPQLDTIDRILAQHYGFTEEEWDFVVNYDVKYRLGSDTESEED